MMQQNQRAPKLQMSFIVKKHIGCRLPQMALVRILLWKQWCSRPCFPLSDLRYREIDRYLWKRCSMSAVFENRPAVGVEGPEKQGYGKSSPARKKVLSFSAVRQTDIQIYLSIALLPQVVGRINKWLPNTYLLENVPNLTSKKNSKFFKKLLRKPLVLNMVMVSMGKFKQSFRRHLIKFRAY